jgi:hypothetical protein
MSKPTQRLSDPTEQRADLDHDREHGGDDRHEAPRAAAARKPYQRPSIQKRRSMSQATLISSGGTSGTLTSGGP